MDRPTWSICGTCGNQYDPTDVQGTHPYRHPVDGPLIDSKENRSESSEKTTDHLPTDPVLRLVLIEKGVIGTEDLQRVEEQLAASGMAITGATKRTPSDAVQGQMHAPEVHHHWGERVEGQFEPSSYCEECGEWVGAFERWQQVVTEGTESKVISGHRSCIEANWGKVKVDDRVTGQYGHAYRPPDPPDIPGNKVG